MSAQFRRDDGQVLGVALVFLVFVSVVLAATLTAAAANLHATQTLRQQRDERYAAEAGVLAAAGRIQSDATRVLGTDPQSANQCDFPAAGADFVVNSKHVSVSCSPRTGSGATAGVANPPRYSVIALPASGTGNEGVMRDNVPNLQLFGPVSSTGACDVQCVPTPAGDPGYVPRSSTVPGLAQPPSACNAGVATFSPGMYTSPPSSACPTWLFQPGAYYFDFTNPGSHEWIIDGNTTVVGGTQNLNQWTSGQPPTLPGACRAPGDPFANDGVQFVFGGDSRIHVGPTGRVELCAQGGTDQQQIAVYGMTSAVGPEQQQMLTQEPTNAVSNSTPPYSAPQQAESVGGGTAHTSIPANSAAAITVNGFQPQDPGAIIESAQLMVVHNEDTAMQSLTIAANDGTTPLQSQTFAPDPACNGVGECTNRLDLTSQFRTDPSLTSRLNVTFTATAPNVGGTYNSDVDAIVLDLTVSSPGGYRQLTGCTQLPIGTTSDPHACPLVSTEPGAQLYVQGSVYAPSGGLDVNGRPDDPVRFSHGIIARTVVFRPGNGGAPIGATVGGALDRSVVLKATVDGTVRLTTSVSFGDVAAFLDPTNPPPKITYKSWDVK